jgi:hypothetical protein
MAEPSSPVMATPEKKRAEQRGAEVRSINTSYKISEAQHLEEYRTAFGEVK